MEKSDVGSTLNLKKKVPERELSLETGKTDVVPLSGPCSPALWSTMDPFAFCISFPEERGSSEGRVEKGGILFLSARNERLYPLFRPWGLSPFPLLYQYVPGRIYFVWFFSFSCVRNRFLLPLDYHQRNREKDYGRKLRMGKIREAI